MEPSTKQICDALLHLGPMYYGSSYEEAENIANEWAEAGFSASDLYAWSEARVWCPITAAQLRNAGLSPQDVIRTAERSTNGSDPVYDLCNSGIGLDEFLEIAKAD